MIAARPAKAIIPSGTPTPIPTLAPVLRPPEDKEGDGVLTADVCKAPGDVALDALVVMADLVAETDDEDGEAELLELDMVVLLLLLLGRLETICPVSDKNTPCPFSQQSGLLSQQKLPSAQTVTGGRNPPSTAVSSGRISFLRCLQR
jgi:hypothetical protein